MTIEHTKRLDRRFDTCANCAFMVYCDGEPFGPDRYNCKHQENSAPDSAHPDDWPEVEFTDTCAHFERAVE